MPQGHGFGWGRKKRFQTPNVYDVPSSITADGSVDVTADLLTWIATVPDGTAESPSILRFPASAVYRVDGEVLIVSRNWLTFEGGTFKRITDGTANQLRIWRFNFGSNLIIRNMAIRGLNPTGALAWSVTPSRVWEHGLAIYGCQSFTVDNLDVQECWGDGMVAQSQWNGAQWVVPTNVTIKNSYIRNTGRSGISLIVGDHLTIQNNEIRRAAVNLIDAEPDVYSQELTHVTIDGNTFEEISNALCLSCSAYVGDNLTITNNTMESVWGNWTLSVWTPPNGGPRINSNLVMTGNSWKWSGGGGVRPQALEVTGWQNCTIDNNVWTATVPPQNQNGWVVKFANVHDSTFNDNSVPTAFQAEPATWDAACTNLIVNGQQVA